MDKLQQTVDDLRITLASLELLWKQHGQAIIENEASMLGMYCIIDSIRHCNVYLKETVNELHDYHSKQKEETK